MINYGKQYIDNDDIKAVTKILKSKFLTQGPLVNKFEKKLKNLLGSKYCCALSSGTAALHLAGLSSLLGKNDYVITSPISFLATSNAILYSNARPIFVDINETTYNIDENLVEKKILELKKKNKYIKALIATDFAGNPCNWKRLKSLSKKYNFLLINDNCHALGAKYYNDYKYAQKFADIVTHSFHPVKQITTGEGGALLTNNKKIFENAIELMNDTTFGLNAGIVTNNLNNVKQFIKQARVGGIRINLPTSQRNEVLPFGGLMDSGYGRGGIISAVKEMTNLKTILW